MMNRNTLVGRLALIFVILFGVASIVAYSVYAVNSTQGLLIWSRSGELEFDFTDADGTMIVSSLRASDFDSGTIPRVGDTLLTFNGTALAYDSARTLVNAITPPGRELTIGFVQEGDTLSATLVSRRAPKPILLQLGAAHAFKFLIVLAFVSISWIALRKRSSSSAVRVLALFSFAAPILIVTGVNYQTHYFPDYPSWLMDPVQSMGTLNMLLFSGFWLHLALLFPQPRKIMLTRKWLGYLFCYAPALAFLIGSRILPDLGDRVSLAFIFTYITAHMTAGFILLGRTRATAKDPMVRRQARIVSLGTMVGIVPFFLILVLVLIFGQDVFAKIPGGFITVILIIFFSFWAIPLSFLIAFNRYGLLNVEAKLRRGTRYVLTIGVLLAVLIAVVLVVSNLMVDVVGITDRTPVVVLAVVMAVSVMPVQRRLQGWIENRFYPERRNLRSFVNSFIRRAATMPDRFALLEELGNSLQMGLGVKTVLPAHIDPSRGLCDLEMNPVPLRERGLLLQDLAMRGNPILVDELLAEEGDELGVEEKEWLASNGITMLLPLVASSGMKGMVALSGRDGEEAFRAEEIQILGTLADQVALAMDNLTLLEENLEKRRLQEQLNLARDIQQGFLPQSIPDTPGLEVAATSLFSLEVAGDYYDVISAESGRTVFAVGDVSGKGAGAAMIMANLQASLRALVRVGTGLSQMVAGINDIIYQNTPTESYITFFAGIYDAKSKKLTYVNAGHNPPMVIRSRANKAEELTAGGLILGVIPGAEYKTGEISLRTGDLLLLFTDGVTEAMDAREEEFGEDRLLKTVLENRKLTAEEIVGVVRQRVIEFSGSDHFDDDFTMLVLRAVAKTVTKSTPAASKGKRKVSSTRKRS